MCAGLEAECFQALGHGDGRHVRLCLDHEPKPPICRSPLLSQCRCVEVRHVALQLGGGELGRHGLHPLPQPLHHAPAELLPPQRVAVLVQRPDPDGRLLHGRHAPSLPPLLPLLTLLLPPPPPPRRRRPAILTGRSRSRRLLGGDRRRGAHAPLPDRRGARRPRRRRRRSPRREKRDRSPARDPHRGGGREQEPAREEIDRHATAAAARPCARPRPRLPAGRSRARAGKEGRGGGNQRANRARGEAAAAAIAVIFPAIPWREGARRAGPRRRLVAQGAATSRPYANEQPVKVPSPALVCRAAGAGSARLVRPRRRPGARARFPWSRKARDGVQRM